MTKVMTCDCGKEYTFRPHLAGKSLECVVCGERLIFPALDRIRAKRAIGVQHREGVLVACSKCNERFTAPTERSGRSVTCPYCEATVMVPSTTSIGDAAAQYLDQNHSDSYWSELRQGEQKGKQLVTVKRPPEPRPKKRKKLKPRTKSLLIGSTVVLGVLVCLGAGIAAYRHVDIFADMDWTEHVSDSGGFAVMMPTGFTAQQFDFTQLTRLAHSAFHFEGVSFIDGTQVGVLYIDLPGTETKDAIPTGIMRFLEREFYGEVEVSWQFDLHLGEHPGTEVAYEFAKSSARRTSYSRWFLVGERLYAVTWMSGYNEPSVSALHVFWDSFLLLDEPEAVALPVESTEPVNEQLDLSE